MSFYSKQSWFCNCCGEEQFSELPLIIGAKEKVCSMNCLKEFQWRETLSIMGKDYYKQEKQQSLPKEEPKNKVNPEDCYRMCEYCDGAADCTCPYCHKENK